MSRDSIRRRPFLQMAGMACVATAAGAITRAEETAPDLHIEGYAGQVSYPQGGELTLHVSASQRRFSVEIARLGARPEAVWKGTSDAGAVHPIPANASSHGCGWPVAVRVPIGPEWKSGYYQVQFRLEDRGGDFVRRTRRVAESTCFFIVRAAQPGRDSRILLQFATNTYNAYNNWGGFSLYAYNGRGGNQGHRVSFQRPPGSLFPNWEQAFVEWAESQGYTLEYAANGDLESHPQILKAYKLVLSVGHDEHWSAPMRDHLESFIGDGGNVAFFSGNTCCWQVRTEDHGSALTCWKQNVQQDPVFVARGSQATLSTLWSHHLVKRPENQLTGVGFLWGGYHKSHGQLMDASGGFDVHRPDHWIFAGTSLKAGERFGAKVTKPRSASRQA
ncbi:MAG: N,N-dimethylformamidase beta subunit family domain-containing protein [Verrucomicrobiota bacterium]